MLLTTLSLYAATYAAAQTKGMLLPEKLVNWSSPSHLLLVERE